MAYSVRADINAIFGTDNVTAWATLSDGDSSATITARVTSAIEFADAYIEALLRATNHKIPVQTEAGATPRLVQELSAMLAGLWLYEPHGVKDIDSDGKPIHRLAFISAKAERMLEDLRTGRLKLDTAMAY